MVTLAIITLAIIHLPQLKSNLVGINVAVVKLLFQTIGLPLLVLSKVTKGSSIEKIWSLTYINCSAIKQLENLSWEFSWENFPHLQHQKTTNLYLFKN